MENCKKGGIKMVAELTGYSTSTLYKLVCNNRIPVHRIPGGSKLIFYENEILDWIKSGNVEQKKSAVSYE